MPLMLGGKTSVWRTGAWGAAGTVATGRAVAIGGNVGGATSVAGRMVGAVARVAQSTVRRSASESEPVQMVLPLWPLPL